MQAFELYFNPKKRDDLLLASFIYTPANVYEKRLGNLYVAGELTQAMPQHSRFLANLSLVIKKEYYASGLKKSCGASLQEALKKGNEFLNQESKNGNVGWLGNLNFGIISFKDSELNFAKIGDIKIFLARANELMDLSHGLETGQFFGSMAEGKIAQEDKIIVLNKRILVTLGKKQKFLGELAKANNEKELKQVLKVYQEPLVNISGICLVLMAAGKNEAKQTVTLQKELPNFSLSLPHIPSLPEFPKINFKFIQKKTILVLSLILILLAFYYIFQGERTQELKDAQTKLIVAKQKAMLAESLLILEKDDQAKALFEEALQIISPLTKRGAPLRDDALFLQNSVKQYLK